MGKTIMVSSHILPELADICNKIGIIERGELLVSADVADVMKQVRQQPILVIARRRRHGRRGEADRAAPTWSSRSRSATAGSSPRWPRASTTTAICPAQLIAAGHKLTLFKEDEINLETAFMALTKGITA